MKRVAVIFIAILALIALAATPGEAISCSDVTSSLMPCLGYLSNGGEPSGSCCGGIQSVQRNAQSKEDRQTVCNCLKSAASSYSIDYNAASNLPGKCGVSVGYSVSPNVDCSQVS